MNLHSPSKSNRPLAVIRGRGGREGEGKSWEYGGEEGDELRERHERVRGWQRGERKGEGCQGKEGGFDLGIYARAPEFIVTPLASMQFCSMTALLMRWQVIRANFAVFCNRSNFVIYQNQMLPKVNNNHGLCKLL